MGAIYYSYVSEPINRVRINESSIGAFAVTPSDTGEFDSSKGEYIPRALFVGGAGDVKLIDLLGNTVTFKNVAGYLFQQCKQVLATGTTATNIIGSY